MLRVLMVGLLGWRLGAGRVAAPAASLRMAILFAIATLVTPNKCTKHMVNAGPAQWRNDTHALVVMAATCSGGYSGSEGMPSFDVPKSNIPSKVASRIQTFERQRHVCGGALRCNFLAHGWRKLLGEMLQALQLSGDSVEVGVFRGEFTSQVLKRWPRGGHHSAVDPYLHFACPEGAYDKQCHFNQSSWDQIYEAPSGAGAHS